MTAPLHNSLSERVAEIVQTTYRALPRNGKPLVRDDGQVEFTILAGIVLINTVSLEAEPQILCASLAWVSSISLMWTLSR